MNFPSTTDILAEFGLEPDGEDPDPVYCEYLFRTPGGGCEAAFSFSEIMQSFQVTLSCEGKEIASISSESVRSVKIFSEKWGSGFRIDFDYRDLKAEAELRLYPDLKLNWWILRTA
jgi:hypothetical protein